MSSSKYVKTETIVKKIEELENIRMYADNRFKEMLDYQIEILNEILKPQ